MKRVHVSSALVRTGASDVVGGGKGPLPEWVAPPLAG